MTAIEFIGSSLSEQTKKERKFLLISSAVGYFIALTGSVPTKLTALGIEFSAKEQGAFIFTIVGVISYFLLAFLIYGWSDFLKWRITYQEFLESTVRDMLNWSQEDQQEYDSDEVYIHINRLKWAYKIRKPTILLTVLFEYALPLIVASFSIFILVFHELKT